MAQLNDLLVNGKLRVVGTTYAPSLKLNTVNITLNTSAISSVTAGSTPGDGLCTAAQVKAYIDGLTS